MRGRIYLPSGLTEKVELLAPGDASQRHNRLHYVPDERRVEKNGFATTKPQNTSGVPFFLSFPLYLSKCSMREQSRPSIEGTILGNVCWSQQEE